MLLTVTGVTIKVDKVLNRALTERRLSEHHSAPIILDRASEDLRGRGAVPIDHHSKRSGVGDGAIWIAFDADSAFGILDLDNRSGFDKQPRQAGCFRQRTSAVSSQINDQSDDAL